MVAAGAGVELGALEGKESLSMKQPSWPVAPSSGSRCKKSPF